MKNIIITGLTSILMTTATPLVVAQSSTTSQENLIAQYSTSTLHTANFVTRRKSTSGTVKVVERGGKKFLEFENFQTSRGPELLVVLHKDQNPASRISEGNYITLSFLKSFRGTQTYQIPDNVNLEDFKSVAIWCREFNVTFGYATLG